MKQISLDPMKKKEKRKVKKSKQSRMRETLTKKEKTQKRRVKAEKMSLTNLMKIKRKVKATNQHVDLLLNSESKLAWV